MLQIEYVNSFHHNYLKLKAKTEENGRTRYQHQIVSTKKLEGLLSAKMYTKDGESGFYYDISSMQALDKWFAKEKIGQNWMDRLVSGLQTALWSLQEYLLDSRNLMIRRDCIFINMESEKIFFLYYPYHIEEERQDMENLLSFLIENADEKEPDTASFLYCLFAKWDRLREAFKPEDMVALWGSHKREKETEEGAVQKTEIPAASQSVKSGQAEVMERKKDLSELIFGRYRRGKKETGRICMAMENGEYRADRHGEADFKPETEQMTQTVYLEIKPEAEERKLYGNGKENRKVICLNKLPLVIGKKEKVADVVLQNASISRMHARITEDEGRIYLEDLNATNGTFKNGARLKPYEKVEILKEDEIKLGKLLFTYR